MNLLIVFALYSVALHSQLLPTLSFPCHSIRMHTQFSFFFVIFLSGQKLNDSPAKRPTTTLKPEKSSARRTSFKDASATSLTMTATRSSSRLRLRHVNIEEGRRQGAWADERSMRGLGLGLGGDEDAMSELSDLSDLSDLSELTALSDLEVELNLQSGGGDDARVTVFPSLTPATATAQAPIPVPQIAQPISPTLPSSAIASSSAYDPPHLPALKRLAAHSALPVILVSPPVETMRGPVSVSATTMKEGKRAWKEKPTQLIYAYPGVSNFIATTAAELVFPLPARAPSTSALSSLTTTSASSTVPHLILTHLTNARPVAEQIRLKQLLRSSDPAWTSSTKGWKALERSICAGWIGRRVVEVAKEKESRNAFFRDGEEAFIAERERSSDTLLPTPVSSTSEDLVASASTSTLTQTTQQVCSQAQGNSSPPSPPKSAPSPTPPPQPIPVTLATTIAYPRLEQRHRFSPRVPSRLRIANVVVPVRARSGHGDGDGDGEDSESGDTDVDVDMDDADTDGERSSDTIPIPSPEQEAVSAVKGSRLYRRIEQFVVGGAGGVISTFGPGPDADVSELSLDGRVESAADGGMHDSDDERMSGDDTNASASTCVPSSPSVSFLAESASSETEDGEEATSAQFEREPTPVPSASLAAVEEQASPNSPLQTPPPSPSVFPRQYPQAWHRRHAEHRMEPPVWKWASLSRVESS